MWTLDALGPSTNPLACRHVAGAILDPLVDEGASDVPPIPKESNPHFPEALRKGDLPVRPSQEQESKSFN